jgi:hypothetical protein
VFNGDAITSSCANDTKFAYGDIHSTNRESIQTGLTAVRYSQDVQLLKKEEAITNPRGETNDAHATFGHRDDFVGEPLTECDVRVRLTPSEPFKKASMWYRQGIEVYSGFECGFRFHMSDLSRRCNYVRDRNFGTKQYKSCRVHGGDGFAFVVHGHVNGTSTLGEGGKHMGYGRIDNSLVVEFDTWYNPEQGDIFYDHVSLHNLPADGGDGDFSTDGAQESQLGTSRPHSLADGREHTARVRYFPEIRYDMLDKFTASSSTLRLLKDAGEMKRVGTLAVYVDDMTEPSFAVPLNLNHALNLPQGTAFVGFTASTGSFWEKHDILGWYCCEEPPCLTANRIGMPLMSSDEYLHGEPQSTMDYHKHSMNLHEPRPPLHADNSEMVRFACPGASFVYMSSFALSVCLSLSHSLTLSHTHKHTHTHTRTHTHTHTHTHTFPLFF